VSFYADRIAELAPASPPRTSRPGCAWSTALDALSPARFAAEVSTALECIEHAGLDECDKLAHSYGLRPRERYALGDKALVARGRLGAGGRRHRRRERAPPTPGQAQVPRLPHRRLHRAGTDRRALRVHLGRARRDQLLPVPDRAIDAFDPPRPELLELAEGDDASRRTSPRRRGDPVDERDDRSPTPGDGSGV
jgi:hypothetical protein